MFRNVKNYSAGGILFILAKNATPTIQNSTVRNISISNTGDAVYIRSNLKDYPQSTNPDRNLVVFYA